MKETIEGDLFQQHDHRGNSDIRAQIGVYLRHWYLFVLGVVVCVTAAWFHLRYTVTEYFVNTTILIKESGQGPAAIANTGLSEIDVFRQPKKIDDEIIVLKSKSLMERTLRELSLNTSYFLEGRVQDMEVYEKTLPLKLIVHELKRTAYNKKIFIFPEDDNSFQLGETRADGSVVRYTYRFGQRITRPYAVFTVVQQPDSLSVDINEKLIVVFHDIKALAARYSNDLVIAPVNKTSNVLSIGLSDPVPARAMDILNELIEVYENEALEDKNTIASNALSFIDDRLRYLTEELTNVEKNVELYKRQNNLTDVSSDAALFLKSADDYNKKLEEFDIQIELLRSIDEYLKVRHGDEVVLVPSSLNIQDPTLLTLISKFNELQLERQRMQRTTNPGNPLMVNLNEQVNNLRLNIGENIRNLIRGLTITRQNLVASSAEFEYRKKMVPAMERELLEINRQQGVKEGLYLYLLQKREESALSLAATEALFRVIDPPGISHAIEPNRPLQFLVAVMMGLALPFAFLYLRGILNDKVMDLKDIERLTTTPVLGEIARAKTNDVLVVARNASSPVVEMFRLLRVNLQFAALRKENKVILVTSSISGEGKSFFSLNFAASLVLTGKKVVVLAMDLRKPALSKAFKQSGCMGITNFLASEEVSVRQILRESDFLPDLFLVGGGPISPSPTELMMSSRMAQLFDVLRSGFDHIIVDSAPIGLVADAFTLAPYVDSVIYLVRRNHTPKEKLSIIDNIYREKKLKYPMIVLNDVRLSGKHAYGYGYGETGRRANGKVSMRRNAKLRNNSDIAVIK